MNLHPTNATSRNPCTALSGLAAGTRSHPWRTSALTGSIGILASALLFTLALPDTPALAATLLSIDFTGRIVNGKTAGNIPWTAVGVQVPGSLTWVPEGGPTNTALFDTPDAQGCFAPDLNIDIEAPWSVTIPVAPATPGILLQEVVINWQHFNNAGAFQTASRSADWTVSVTGSGSGLLGSITASNVSGLSGVTTLTFTPALALSGADSYGVKLFVRGNSTGNNTSLDALTLIGVINSNIIDASLLRIALTGSGIDLAWNSRTGMLYNLRGNPDLAGAVSNWPVVAGNLAATPPTNTQHLASTPASQVFALQEFPLQRRNILVLLADD